MMRPRKLRRILALAGFGAITAGALTGTAVAKASPVDEYTLTNAAAICQFLDTHPNVTGVEMALAEIVLEDGFTAYQGGEIVGRAVFGFCPEHASALQEFVAKWDEPQPVGAVGGRLPA